MLFFTKLLVSDITKTVFKMKIGEFLPELKRNNRCFKKLFAVSGHEFEIIFIGSFITGSSWLILALTKRYNR